jgi:L-lactate utilization protein LutC
VENSRFVRPEALDALERRLLDTIKGDAQAPSVRQAPSSDAQTRFSLELQQRVVRLEKSLEERDKEEKTRFDAAITASQAAAERKGTLSVDLERRLDAALTEGIVRLRIAYDTIVIARL